MQPTQEELDEEAREAEHFLQQIRARRAALPPVPVVQAKPKKYTAEEIHLECQYAVEDLDNTWYSKSAKQKRRREMKRINAEYGTDVSFDDLHKLGMDAVIEYWFIGKEVQLFDQIAWEYCTYRIHKPKTSGAKLLVENFHELDEQIQDLLFIRDDGTDYSEGIPVAALSNRYDVDRELRRVYKSM